MSDMTDTVNNVGLAALNGLLYRKGIKHELESVQYDDEELWAEIVEETGKAAIAAHVASLMKPKGKAIAAGIARFQDLRGPGFGSEYIVQEVLLAAMLTASQDMEGK